jgi:hypothetical protein
LLWRWLLLRHILLLRHVRLLRLLLLLLRLLLLRLLLGLLLRLEIGYLLVLGIFLLLTRGGCLCVMAAHHVGRAAYRRRRQHPATHSSSHHVTCPLPWFAACAGLR